MGKQKSAFVAIIGRPNAGKSSIMNRLLGQKVVIVSDKPQTTRTRVMGVLTVGDNQYVFVDTPGFHKPRTVLGENMVKAVGDGMSDVELCLLIVDAEKKPSEIEKELCKKLKKGKQPAILVINKIDLIKEKTDLLSVILEYNKLYDFAAVVPCRPKTATALTVLWRKSTSLQRTAYICSMRTPSPTSRKGACGRVYKGKAAPNPRQGNSPRNGPWL